MTSSIQIEREPLLQHDILPQLAPPPKRKQSTHTKDPVKEQQHQKALNAILEQAEDSLINVTGPSPYLEVYDNALSSSPSLLWRGANEGSMHSMKTVRKGKHSAETDNAQADTTNDTIHTWRTASDGALEGSETEQPDAVPKTPSRLFVSSEENDLMQKLLFNLGKAIANPHT